MPRLKYFNNTSQEWEYVIVGGQGPQGEQGIQGEPGVISATDPIIYNVETQNVSLGSPDYITFDTTPETSSTTPGTIFWDTGEGTPTVVLNSDVNLSLGQENVALCYNGTGSTITNGSVVYISGAQGQRPSITLADADAEATSSKTFGMVTEDIADGTEGFVTTFGIVNGINTYTFTEGQALWLSQTAGQVTATRPLAPAHTVFVGYCLKSNATSGRIFVNPQNGYELNELHDVLIEETVADNELIARDATSGLWKNQTAAEAGLSEIGHTHDDRYYTESETDTLLNAKASLSGATFTGVVTSNNNFETSGKLIGTTQPNAGSDGGVAVKAPSSGTQTSAFLQFVNNAYSVQLASLEATPSSELKLNATHVLKPYQVMFHATGTSSVTNSGSNVPYNVVNRNVGNGYNTSTYRFTAPVAGTYIFTYQHFTSGGSAGAVDFYVNGVRKQRSGREYADTSYIGDVGSIVLYLNAGDYCYSYIYTGTVHINQDYSAFTGYLLG